jgi:hypothetical protein
MAMATKKQSGSSGKATFREVQPNAARTMAALREMGYDSFSAIMDLIDNSLDAGAKNVDVTVKDRLVAIDIADDGVGMDAKTLAEALRLGSDIEHNAGKDLGKFGMGLNTASISMARRLWVVTRQEGKTAFESTLDLDTISRENRFVITDPKPASSRFVTENIGDHGTLVRLEEIDRISDTNASRFAASLRTKLGQVYRHFLAQGVKIKVNNRNVARYDPLMLDHPATEIVFEDTLDLGDKTQATLKIVELPELGTAGDAEANIYPHNSGFYVVRNGREIIAGETFGFYRHHHSYSHFRAELAYTGNSTVFHEDVKKASIHPDDRLRERLKRLTEKYIQQSGRRGRERGQDQPLNLSHKAAEETINERIRMGMIPLSGNGSPKKGAAAAEAKDAKGKAAEEPVSNLPAVEFTQVAAEAKGRFFHAEQKDGKFIIYYNSKHPLCRLVADMKQRQAAAILDWLAFSIAKAEAETRSDGKLMERAGDYLATLAAPAPANKE